MKVPPPPLPPQNFPKSVLYSPQATVRSALETGTLDLEGRALSSLAPGLFEDGRTLSAVTRAKLSGNKLQVRRVLLGVLVALFI